MATIGEVAADDGAKPGQAIGAFALPLLTGWKFASFRILWFAALALAAGATIAGLHYQKVWYDKVILPSTDLGLRLISPPDILGQPIGSQARTAGITAGLRLIAIDGRPLRPGATQVEIAAALDRPDGAQVRILTRSPEGQVREHMLTRSSSHLAEAYAPAGISYAQRRLTEWITMFAAAAVNIVAAIMLFRRRAEDPVAAMLSLAFLLLVLGYGGARSTLYVFGAAVLSDSAVLIGYGLLYAGITVFPDGRVETRWRRVLLLAIIALVVAGLLANAGILYFPEDIFTLVAIAMLAASVASLWARYRRLPMGVARQQIRWAFLGFALGAALGSAPIIIGIAGGVNPNGATGIWVNMLFNVTSWVAFAFLPLGVLISLLRYRLYDADAAISRSAGYAVLTLMLAGTFGASAKLIEWFFETYFGGDAGALPGAIGAGLAVILITPMHHRIQNWAERRFQKALLYLRRDLPDCVGDLRETAGMAELLREVLDRAMAGTRAIGAAVVIDGERVAARGDEGDYRLSVPLRIGHQGSEIGTLLVGPRPDGSTPGKDEREALGEVADPIARAMRIVGLRERERAERIAERDGLRTIIDAIADRLDRLEAKAR